MAVAVKLKKTLSEHRSMVAFVILCWLTVTAAVLVPSVPGPPPIDSGALFVGPSIHWVKNERDKWYKFDRGEEFFVAFRVMNEKTKTLEWTIDKVKETDEGFVYADTGEEYDDFDWKKFEYFARANEKRGDL